MLSELARAVSWCELGCDSELLSSWAAFSVAWETTFALAASVTLGGCSPLASAARVSSEGAVSWFELGYDSELMSSWSELDVA